MTKGQDTSRKSWTLMLALLIAPLAVFACSRAPLGPVTGDGPISQFSLAAWQSGTRHSELTEITRDNVRNLDVAWEYHTGEIDNAVDAMVAFEDEPILVDGNLIICTITRRVIALDPATGEERWVYDPRSDTGRVRKCRGVSAWTDAQAAQDAPCKTRILWATDDNRLLAVDSRTGQACPGFGQNGQVRIEATMPELFRGEFTSASRPAIVNGVVIVGSAVADNQRVNGPSGRVMAYDARTGAFRWSFDPLPRDRANPAARTWPNGAGAGALGGANVWSTMSVDEERDLVYLPTTAPSGDFYGGERAGDNLYANSLVAVRGSTGEVVWHFQFVHHDVWDYDLPVGPLLIDYPVNSQNVPALIQLTKQGLIFIFNRETGEPIAPVEERPVPQAGGVPTEPLSPTQPFPVDMPTIAPQGFTTDDAWGFTPFDRGSCRDRVERLTHGPIYTPPSTRGTVFMPGSSGGANWGGGAYDPATNILIAPSTRVPMVMTLLPRAEAEGQVDQSSIETRGAMTFPIEGSDYIYRMEPLMSSFGAPCSRPPWSALVAINVVTREIVWESPLGTIDRLTHSPFAIALGTPGAGGPLVTAGGVVFIGHTLDNRFRAFDLRTGRELWRSRTLPAPATATPITYQAGGRQFVVIAAGGHSMYSQERSDTVMAYRLR